MIFKSKNHNEKQKSADEKSADFKLIFIVRS